MRESARNCQVIPPASSTGSWRSSSFPLTLTLTWTLRVDDTTEHTCDRTRAFVNAIRLKQPTKLMCAIYMLNLFADAYSAGELSVHVTTVRKELELHPPVEDTSVHANEHPQQLTFLRSTTEVSQSLPLAPLTRNLRLRIRYFFSLWEKNEVL